MNIKDGAILNALIHTMENSVVPGIQSQEAMMQAKAVIALLQGLRDREEVKDWVFTRDISSLKGLFEDILQYVDAMGDDDTDGVFNDVKREIQSTLNRDCSPSRTQNLVAIDFRLNELLESTIMTLAKAEESAKDAFLSRIREIRKEVRRFMRKQHELKKNLYLKGLELDFVSKE
ncbi:MAG: hypothetical protein RBT11_20205 [Desulfobacterales bacterium]|jgi:hypothetical protein|nr:hypothetical protein [Desulfobacterales bacterium]